MSRLIRRSKQSPYKCAFISTHLAPQTERLKQPSSPCDCLWQYCDCLWRYWCDEIEKNCRRARSREHRSGMLLIAVLACLAIVSSLGLTALTSTIRMHRESKNAFQLRQTQLLIDSAIRRAEVLREQGKNMINETWKPRLPGVAYTAEIKIEAKDQTLFITSTLRSASGFQTRRSDQVPFQLESP